MAFSLEKDLAAMFRKGNSISAPIRISTIRLIVSKVRSPPVRAKVSFERFLLRSAALFSILLIFLRSLLYQMLRSVSLRLM